MIADPTTEPVALRVETAARLLDATPAQVLFWIRTKRLPAYKLGRAWRVRRADIEALREEAGTTQ